MRRPSSRPTPPFVIVSAACVGIAVGGCADRALTAAGGTDSGSTSGAESGGLGPVTREVYEEPGADILFVVDNSGAMGQEQGKLAAGIGAMLEVFERPEVNLDVRIGVTTTDNGHPQCEGTTPEGGKLQAVSCRARESDFVLMTTGWNDSFFQEACADWCPETLADLSTIPTTTHEDDEAVPRAWVERIDGVTNLPEGVSVEDALRCFLPQGINGCGFEAPLESMWKALQLGEMIPSSPNFGFRRPGAILAVVFVTDEADCSLNPDASSIFDPEGDRVFWSDPTANFPTSAVCWNAGVSCTGGPGTYTSCDPANKDVFGNEGVSEDEAALLPVSRYVQLLRYIQSGQWSPVPWSGVVVAGLVGVPLDYAQTGEIVYQDGDDPAFLDAFGIGPGCSSASETAVPPVRMRDLAAQFGVPDGPLLRSICADDFAPALRAIGEAIAARKRGGCVTWCVEDEDRGTFGYTEASCVVTETYATSSGTERREVPPCTLTCGGAPCEASDGPDGWAVPQGAEVCYRMLVDRVGRT
ncbi:MAG: VWA domain-containing protein, partial [Deltaproteobacteria bacterium]